MHVDCLGLGAAVAVAVSEGPGNHEVTLPKRSKHVRRASDCSVTVVGCCRRCRQICRTLPGYIRQAARVWYGRHGVVHVNRLSLSTAVAVTVSEGPCNHEITLTKWPGVGRRPSDGSVTVVGCRRRRWQRCQALRDHIRQAARVWYGRHGVVHVNRLSLSTAVAVTVSEGPCNHEITLTKWPGVGRRASDGSVTVVGCRRRRWQRCQALRDHSRQAARVW